MQSHLLLGIKQLEEGKNQDALKTLTQSIEKREPAKYRAQVNRGFAYMRLRMWDEAEADFKAGLHHLTKPTEQKLILKNLGFLYVDRSCATKDPAEQAKYRKLARDNFEKSDNSAVIYIDMLDYIDSLEQKQNNPKQKESKLELQANQSLSEVEKTLFQALISNAKKDSDNAKKCLNKLFVEGEILKFPLSTASSMFVYIYLVNMITSTQFFDISLQIPKTTAGKIKDLLINIIDLIPDQQLRFRAKFQALSNQTFLGKILYTKTGVMQPSITSGRLKIILDGLVIEKDKLQIDAATQKMLAKDQGLKDKLKSNASALFEVLYKENQPAKGFDPTMYSKVARVHAGRAVLSKQQPIKRGEEEGNRFITNCDL